MGVLSEIPVLGYYATHFNELNNCSSTYSATQILALLIIAAFMTAFSLAFWIIVFTILHKSSTG